MMTEMINKEGKNSKLISLVLLHITFMIYSLAAVCSKQAGSQGALNIKFICYYGLTLIILVVYAVLWQQNLKRMSLITAYANKAVTVIWGLVWGVIFYQEKVRWNQILGIAIIVIGICIMVREKEE